MGRSHPGTPQIPTGSCVSALTAPQDPFQVPCSAQLGSDPQRSWRPEVEPPGAMPIGPPCTAKGQGTHLLMTDSPLRRPADSKPLWAHPGPVCGSRPVCRRKKPTKVETC